MRRGLTRPLSAWILCSFVVIGCGGRSTTLDAATSGAGGMGGGSTGAAGAKAGVVDPWFSSGSRLRAVYLDAGDVHRVDHWYDSQLGAECRFTKVGDGTYRCLVGEGWWGYLDDACSIPAALAPDPCGSPGNGYRLLDAPSCGTRAMKMGAVVEGTSQMFGAGPGCQPFSVPAGTKVYALTDVPLTTFVGGKTTLVPVDDAIAVETVIADDGTRATLSTWDRAENRSCGVWTNSPVKACGPPSASESGLSYLDSGCSQPATWAPQASPCLESTLFMLVRDPSYQVVGFYPFVGASVTASLWSNGDGACKAVSGGPLLAQPLGPLRPMSSFPLLHAESIGAGAVRLGQWRTASGAVVPGDMTYSADGAECDLITFVDGTTRCVPGGFGEVSAFADPECTHPLVRSWDHAAATVVSFEKVPTLCPSRAISAIAVGAEVFPETVYSGPPCHPDIVQGHYYEVGPPVDFPKIRYITD
jgi:hypothetical protein